MSETVPSFFQIERLAEILNSLITKKSARPMIKFQFSMPLSNQRNTNMITGGLALKKIGFLLFCTHRMVNAALKLVFDKYTVNHNFIINY